jgi:hypothetical protein
MDGSWSTSATFTGWTRRAVHAVFPSRRREHTIQIRLELHDVKTFGVAGFIDCRIADVIPHIQIARLQPLKHPTRHAVPQRGFNTRVGLHQCTQKPAEPQEFGIENRTDGQPPADLIPQRGGDAPYFARGIERAFGVRQQRFAIARDDQTVRRPHKKRDSQRLLQILDLQADCGLGYVQLHGRSREIPLTGNSHKGAKKSQVHA